MQVMHSKIYVNHAIEQPLANNTIATGVLWYYSRPVSCGTDNGVSGGGYVEYMKTDIHPNYTEINYLQLW